MPKRAKRKTKSKSKKKAKRKAAPRRKVRRRASPRAVKDMMPRELRMARRRRSERRFGTIEREFDKLVNMTPTAISKWLKTKESREAGWRRSERAGEPAGHWSGRRIIEIQKTKKNDLVRADHAHMRKVIAFIKRHSAQRPDGDVRKTPWRYALMNWGHDPLKGKR